MSKPFDPSRDEAWAESELRRACAELDGHIPDGYFEDFSSRLAANLEREFMQSTETKTPDEHSGLHEIKALATSARAKISRRRTTENDLEDALLASSSSGLPAVVLPDPELSSPQLEVLAQTSPPIHLGPSMERKSAKPWLLVGIASTALAAAAAVVLLLNSGGSDEPTPAPTGETVSAASPEAAARSMTVEPLPGAAPALQEGSQELAAGLVAGNDELDEDEAAAPPPAKGDEVRLARERSNAVGGASTASGSADAKEAKSEDKKNEAPAPLEDEKTKSKGGSGAEGLSDINDILNEVTGGPSPELTPKEEEKKVDKKRLDGNDVKTAMGAIRSKVNACGSKAEFTGRVSMKFSVDPSGKVTKAKGSAADSNVATCVESAVKSARFPSFEPPSMSFSYPFLITD